MADLTGLLPDDWEKNINVSVVYNFHDQVRDAMVRAGLEPPAELYFDGQLHRFDTGKKRDKRGWYVLFDGDIPAGKFGNWGDSADYTWRANIGRELSFAEQIAHSKRMSEAKAARDVELKRTREVAADTAEQIWQTTNIATDHPYLLRKGIKPHGVHVTGDGRLVIPAINSDGKITTLQYISDNGDKIFHTGGEAGGKYWTIGNNDTTIYIAEGFATAASIHEATNNLCYIAFSASNLPAIAKMAREKHGNLARIVIVADNDESGTGERKAKEACDLIGARFVMPPMIDQKSTDANDWAMAGNSLSELLNPPKKEENKFLISADEFCSQPAPLAWLAKRWIQRYAMHMVHGPSGGGKTFVVLDAVLHIAAGLDQWQGNKTRKGNVIYLAGEGHHGLRSRIAAWKHANGISQPLSMWVSSKGCDLNTPEGYIEVVDAINEIGITPDIIVIDTLHRFLAGDENSAQDAKTMLDAAGGLMRDFKCSTLFVHHTGVDEGSQHRARGSSAWRGALDIEISVVPATDSKPMEVIQRKSKDTELAEPLYLELEGVELPGWFDEDGQPVGSAVIRKAAPTIEVKEYTKDQRALISACHVAIGNGYAMFEDGKFIGFDTETLREIFYSLEENAGKGSEANKKSYQRARDAFGNSGNSHTVFIEDTGVILRANNLLKK